MGTEFQGGETGSGTILQLGGSWMVKLRLSRVPWAAGGITGYSGVPEPAVE